MKITGVFNGGPELKIHSCNVGTYRKTDATNRVVSSAIVNPVQVRVDPEYVKDGTTEIDRIFMESAVDSTKTFDAVISIYASEDETKVVQTLTLKQCMVASFDMNFDANSNERPCQDVVFSVAELDMDGISVRNQWTKRA